MNNKPLSVLLMVALIDSAMRKLEAENKQLREQAAGYDRLRTVNGQLKGRIAELENRIASSDETTRTYWTMIQNGNAEVRQLKERLEGFQDIDRYYGSIERRNEEMEEQVQDLARKNINLAAEVERVELLEQQLAAADARTKELEAALVLANLPAISRDNVIQMTRTAA